MSYETLLSAVEGPVAVLTLNRPKVLNALNALMLRELDAAFTAFAEDPALRVLLLLGAGDKAFAAGADINELAALDAASAETFVSGVQRTLRRIETLGKPVLACIHGFAAGGGCEIAMACTLRLASESARIGLPEIKLGIIPGFGGTQRLPRLVGAGAALKMVLTGTLVDAAEALRIGLVDEVVPGGPDELMARARELATTLAAMPPLAVAAAIEAIGCGADRPLDEALALEAGLFGRLCATADKREGTRAFLEKRPAIWSGQ
jgi:enoyl-CoA hydratase